jgi:hypothetical protein
MGYEKKLPRCFFENLYLTTTEQSVNICMVQTDVAEGKHTFIKI